MASLSVADQDLWLDAAVLEKMSVADLRGEVRAQRRREVHAEGVPPLAASPAETVVLCPTCGQVIAAP